MTRNLNLLPWEERTEDLCARAFERDANNIKHIPDKFLSEPICALAASRGARVADMPDQFRSTRVCLLSMKHSVLDYCKTEDIPPASVTIELFRTWVGSNPLRNTPVSWFPVLRRMMCPELETIIRGEGAFLRGQPISAFLDRIMRSDGDALGDERGLPPIPYDDSDLVD